MSAPAEPQACGEVCNGAANGLTAAPAGPGTTVDEGTVPGTGCDTIGWVPNGWPVPGWTWTYFVEYTARYWVTGTLTACWTYCVTSCMHSRGHPVQGSISVDGL
jgi:hypothetical protein